MDFAKMFEAAKLPAAILIGIGILGAIISIIPGIGMIIGGMLAVLSFFVLTPIILAWSGYMHAKKDGADLLGGAVVGGMVGVIVAAVNGVVSIVFTMLGFGAAITGGSDAMAGAAIGAISMIAMVIGLFAGIVIMFIEGLFFGAIGSFLSKHI